MLAKERTALLSTFEDLSIRYDSISIDFEKLSSDYLKRDQELESLKESYDDLKKDNTSLFAEQTETFPVEFVPPCLKCLERSNTDSTAETSSAAERNATTIIIETNTSTEEYVAISDENSRLKNLRETGMLKSLKGHQPFVMCSRSQFCTRTPERKVWVSRESSILMVHTRPSNNIQGQAGSLPRVKLSNLHYYLDMTVPFLLIMMSHLTLTTNYSSNRMVMYLLGILALTSGQAHPRSRYG